MKYGELRYSSAQSLSRHCMRANG